MSEETFDVRLMAEWRSTADAVAVPSSVGVVAHAGTEHASRVAVVAELEDVRLAIEELSASLDEPRNRRLATRAWTVLDVLAHLASWSHETRVEAERLLDGRPFEEIIPFGVDGPHAWNQREVEVRRGRSPADLLAEVAAEHERLIELLTAISDAEAHQVVDLPRTIGNPAAPWRMPLTSMILMTCWHARGHLNRLQRVLRES